MPSGGGLSTRWIAVIAGAVSLAVLVAMAPFVLFVAVARTHQPAPVSSSAEPSPTRHAFTTIPCDQLEHTQVHYHAYVQIFLRGAQVALPEDIGRPGDCYYWLHMHTGESGIIHVEAPADRTFTLGDFFAVWSDQTQVAQVLDTKHVAAINVNSGETLVAYVDLDDGAGPSVFTGDPSTIVLKNHEVITLEVTPPTMNPPPAFKWPDGF